MAAQWKLLTEHLAGASGDVRLTWSELDAIVGGVPNSAVDHSPSGGTATGPTPAPGVPRATKRLRFGQASPFGSFAPAPRRRDRLARPVQQRGGYPQDVVVESLA
jgi:hypothetical protein